MYFYGDGTDVDYEEAVQYLNDACELGSADAMFLLGMCYEEGYGVEQDLEMAAELYQAALDAGYEPDEEDAEILTAILGEAIEAAVEEAVAEDAEVLSMDSADISPLGAIMFYAILEAAMDVDLEEKAAAGDDGFSEDGTVFSLLEDVLNEMSESTDEDGTEDEDTLSQLVYGLSTLGEEDEMSEEELDDLLGLMLLAIGAEEEETESEAVDLSSYSIIGYDIAAYVIAAVEANEVIAEAVEATDSTLFEILESFIDADANNADADALNARLADLEAELEKVADYIDTTEGPKHAALDLLGIVDTIADESIAYYYGHTYADAE